VLLKSLRLCKISSAHPHKTKAPIFASQPCANLSLNLPKPGWRNWQSQRTQYPFSVFCTVSHKVAPGCRTSRLTRFTASLSLHNPALDRTSSQNELTPKLTPEILAEAW
jgi:hypothetical protein